MEISNRRKLQKIASRHSSDVDFKDFGKLYKHCTKEPYSFAVNKTIFPSSKPVRFRKRVLVKKSMQSTTNSSKTKLNIT